MHYTIYKITNKINGNFYIGKHKTKNLDDGYMGSGKLIKAAIKKYGKENFTKEILEFFDTEEEMNEAEKRYVVLGEGSYNICPGGQGGWGYINNSGLNWTPEKNKRISGFKNFTLEQRRYYAVVNKSHLYIEKYRENVKLGLANPPKRHRPMSEEHRNKIGKANSIKQKGSLNSQFGIRFKWMNKNNINKKVPLQETNDYLSNDWVFGRSKSNSTMLI